MIGDAPRRPRRPRLVRDPRPGRDRIAALGAFLSAEPAAERTFGPAEDREFAAREMPFDTVRVLVVGRDPYPTQGHAIGLAFAVDRSVRQLSPSLLNGHARNAADLGRPAPVHGDPSAWVA